MIEYRHRRMGDKQPILDKFRQKNESDGKRKDFKPHCVRLILRTKDTSRKTSVSEVGVFHSADGDLCSSWRTAKTGRV